MNGLERVTATVRGMERDRCPASLVLSLYGARLTGCPLREYYTSGEKYAEGQCAVKTAFDVDILFSPFELTAIGEAFGSKVRFFGNNPPNLTVPAVASADEVLALDYGHMRDHPGILFLHDATARLAKAHGHDTAIAAIFLSPFDMLPLVLGMDRWLETVLFDEPLAKRIVEHVTGFFVENVNRFFDEGAQFIVLPVVFCNPRIITQRIVTQSVIPSLAESFARVKGPIVLHHGGAAINGFISQLSGLPNVIGFAIDRMDRFDVARRAVGADVMLLGNMDGPTLNRKNPDVIMKQCMRILDDRRDDPRFILITSGPDVPYDTDPENIHAVIRSVKQYGCGI